VVIKVLPPDLAAGLKVERFRREIRLAASLQHPHIVPVLQAGQAGELLYYTTPYIEGESLRARLEREGELPVADAVELLRAVVDALSYAHRHGVVHRDIKPENVLLDEDGHALVTDFGVAKAVSAAARGEPLAATGLVIATPAYLAPEQAAAGPHVDQRADLYALGVMAYEVLTGEPPFGGRPLAALLAAHAIETPEPLTKRRASVPPALGALVMRLLEKRPADRPQSAEAVHDALEAVAMTASAGTMPVRTAATETDGTMPEAAPAPSARRRRRRRRRRLALRTGVIVGLLLLLLVLAGAIFAWRTQREARARGVVGATSEGPIRLAVLPFENLGRPEDAYFADRMTEEVRGKLAALPELEVIARSSSNQYKQSAKPARWDAGNNVAAALRRRALGRVLGASRYCEPRRECPRYRARRRAARAVRRAAHREPRRL
jgi:serine/threonine-protein kinase